jgi:hypothetical protein
MKLKILTLLIIFFSSLVALAQSDSTAYSIANQLYIQLKGPASNPTLTIDSNVMSELRGIFSGSGEAIADSLQVNPFLKGKITFKSVPGDRQLLAAVVLVPNQEEADNAIGLSVTNVADAVATLMIDRAKEELTLAFFNHLQSYSDQHPEFKTLFPKTFDALSKLAAYSYPQILPMLRTAFLADLDQVPYNLEAVLELPRYQTLVDNFPEINMAISVLKTYHQLESGSTPDKIIAAIDQAVTTIVKKYPVKESPLFKNMVTTVHFAQLFSASLHVGGSTGTWISGSAAQNLLSQELLTDLYLGMLWQQAGGLSYSLPMKKQSENVSLRSLMAAQAGNVLLFQNKIRQFLALVGKMNKVYPKIKANNFTADDYSKYIGTSLDVIDFALSFVKQFDQRLESDDYLAIAEKSGDLYNDIYAKQYTQAVSDGLDVLGSIQTLTAADGGDNIPTSSGAFSFDMSSDTLTSFVKKIKPYAMFIANVAEAQSENDIESALDNAILPVGSSSIKKNTGNNLCLQTYLGGYYSFHNFSPDAIRAWSDKVGVYGPVGLAYTPGLTSWGNLGSLSLFASAFDLGAIIDYKLKQDPSVTTSTNAADASSKTKAYSVNLNQLFSPGVHIVYGFFSNLPLSLGVGAEYGPGLSTITTTGTSNVINPCWRFNIFLAVDLPFFNLINTPRTK